MPFGHHSFRNMIPTMTDAPDITHTTSDDFIPLICSQRRTNLIVGGANILLGLTALVVVMLNPGLPDMSKGVFAGVGMLMLGLLCVALDFESWLDIPRQCKVTRRRWWWWQWTREHRVGAWKRVELVCEPGLAQPTRSVLRIVGENGSFNPGPIQHTIVQRRSLAKRIARLAKIPFLEHADVDGEKPWQDLDRPLTAKPTLNSLIRPVCEHPAFVIEDRGADIHIRVRHAPLHPRQCGFLAASMLLVGLLAWGVDAIGTLSAEDRWLIPATFSLLIVTIWILWLIVAWIRGLFGFTVEILPRQEIRLLRKRIPISALEDLRLELEPLGQSSLALVTPENYVHFGFGWDHNMLNELRSAILRQTGIWPEQDVDSMRQK